MMGSDIRTKRRAEIATRAMESFKGHVLKDEGHGRWYCARPDTCNYSFRVTDFKDGLILSGDIGELVLVVYGRNPIAWLRGCIKSEDYVLGKIPHKLRQRDMIPDMVREFFKESEGDEDESKIVRRAALADPAIGGSGGPGSAPSGIGTPALATATATATDPATDPATATATATATDPATDPATATATDPAPETATAPAPETEGAGDLHRRLPRLSGGSRPPPRANPHRHPVERIPLRRLWRCRF